MCIEIWIPKLLKELKNKKKEEFASCSYISYFWCNILELILFCLLNFSSLGLFSVFCKFLFFAYLLTLHTYLFLPPLPCLSTRSVPTLIIKDQPCIHYELVIILSFNKEIKNCSIYQRLN